MESREIASRLAREIDFNHFSSSDRQGNRSIYPLSTVSIAASLMGARTKAQIMREGDSFFEYLQTTFFSSLFYNRYELQSALSTSSWNGGLVLPVFTNGGISYLREHGIEFTEQDFFKQLAIESLNPEKDNLLKAITLYGADILFLGMSRANSNYTTLTDISANLNWGRRLSLRNPESIVTIRRRSKKEYINSLETILGEEGKNQILAGDCTQTREMYSFLLHSEEFYNDPKAVVNHTHCEAQGSENCEYVLTFIPKVRISELLLNLSKEAFSQIFKKSDAAQKLMESENRFRLLTADLSQANAALLGEKRKVEDKNAQLERAHAALRQQYEASDETLLSFRSMLDELARGPIHTAKNDFKGLASQTTEIKTAILYDLCRRRGIIPMQVGLLDRSLKELEDSYSTSSVDQRSLRRLNLPNLRERLAESPLLNYDDISTLNSRLIAYIFDAVDSSTYGEEGERYDSIRSALNAIDLTARNGSESLADLILDPQVREEPKPVSINSILTNLSNKCKVMFPNYNFEFKLTDEDVSLSLRSNSVERALYDLLRNCVDATPESGTIRIYSQVEDSSVSLKLINPGTISEDLLDDLNAGLAKSTKTLGTGSGTKYARRILADHNGNLIYRNLGNCVETEAKFKLK